MADSVSEISNLDLSERHAFRLKQVSEWMVRMMRQNLNTRMNVPTWYTKYEFECVHVYKWMFVCM